MILKKTPIFPFLSILIFLTISCLSGCKESSYEFGELSRLAGDTTDKGPIGHGFTDIYERFFYPLKYAPIKIFEIGIAEGASLSLWEKYFPHATVYGIDIFDRSDLNSKRIKTFVADQAKRNQLMRFIRKYGNAYDIILDDGGHSMPQQQISFGFLFKFVKPGGYYIIEDLHTSLPQFFPSFHVEEGGADSTLRMINHLIETRKIESKYLTIEEKNYLQRNIEYVVLFGRNISLPSITCIVKKKKE